MRFYIIALLVALFFSCALALKAAQKPILVTYPDDTPQSVIDEAMAAIKNAGGVVTHEYTLFKGFAAKAADATIATIKTLGSEYVPVVEADAIVDINNS